jgi:hypothetical protein
MEQRGCGSLGWAVDAGNGKKIRREKRQGKREEGERTVEARRHVGPSDMRRVREPETAFVPSLRLF